MTTALENATRLYMEGIRDGDYAWAIEAYAGDRYTQHSHPVPDGKEGFTTFFAAFVQAHPEREIEILRSFQDGQYVFLHALQTLDGGDTKWVTMDIFDTDRDGRLIEHWDMIQAWADTSTHGLPMTGGPTEVVDLHQTEANKNRVRRFVEEVMLAKRPDRVADHASGHVVGPLVERARSLAYLSVHLLVGQGSFVALMAHADRGGDDVALMDLYRVADGRIVDHWDSVEAIVPREQWVNGGKF